MADPTPYTSPIQKRFSERAGYKGDWDKLYEGEKALPADLLRVKEKRAMAIGYLNAKEALGGEPTVEQSAKFAVSVGLAPPLAMALASTSSNLDILTKRLEQKAKDEKGDPLRDAPGGELSPREAATAVLIAGENKLLAKMVRDKEIPEEMLKKFDEYLAPKPAAREPGKEAGKERDDRGGSLSVAEPLMSRDMALAMLEAKGPGTGFVSTFTPAVNTTDKTRQAGIV
jgi:hypothetical protein